MKRDLMIQALPQTVILFGNGKLIFSFFKKIVLRSKNLSLKSKNFFKIIEL